MGSRDQILRIFVLFEIHYEYGLKPLNERVLLIALIWGEKCWNVSLNYTPRKKCKLYHTYVDRLPLTDRLAFQVNNQVSVREHSQNISRKLFTEKSIISYSSAPKTPQRGSPLKRKCMSISPVSVGELLLNPCSPLNWKFDLKKNHESAVYEECVKWTTYINLHGIPFTIQTSSNTSVTRRRGSSSGSILRSLHTNYVLPFSKDASRRKAIKHNPR
jgi:hypothetical protein